MVSITDSMDMNLGKFRAGHQAWYATPRDAEHFSPRSPRGHGEVWRFKSPSPALQEGLPRGPCHVPAPPVCLQLVVTSTSTCESSLPGWWRVVLATVGKFQRSWGPGDPTASFSIPRYMLVVVWPKGQQCNWKRLCARRGRQGK